MGIGVSRPQARQIVLHKHITVNGKKVNIPSYQVKEGDVIAVTEKSSSLDIFKELRDAQNTNVPKWLDFDSNKLEGKVIAKPQRDDIDMLFEEHLVVEYYSKL
jgi:small subunit ribosomal protein S4